MKTVVLSVLLVCGLAYAGAFANPRIQPLFLACDSTRFTATLDAEQLRRRFGAENVARDSILLGEGFFETGTILFPGDSMRRVDIAWKDTVNQRMPFFIRVTGTNSEWRTAHGLALGTTLREAEILNRKPFRLAGFGFDGSGFVISWSGGQLDDAPGAPCTVRARFDRIGPREGVTRELYVQVRGDREFSSGHPAMQALNPMISEIVLRY